MITQAQIKAALKECTDLQIDHEEAKLFAIMKAKNSNLARCYLALTAAAEVGEQDKNWIAKRADIRNSAIERCAQVAETLEFPCEINMQTGSLSMRPGTRQEIAAEIRALKEDH